MNIEVTLKRLVWAVDQEDRQRDRLLAAFEQARPNLEAAAAAGDAEAAELLALHAMWMEAELAFVPSPDRPDYVTLAWVSRGDDEKGVLLEAGSADDGEWRPS